MLGCHVEAIKHGTLNEVNSILREKDKLLAAAIRQKKIDGLIAVSSDVDLHEGTFKAASEERIPVTGSGGSSISAAISKFGIDLAGNAGGSVATTAYMRAVSYATALGAVFVKQYHPLSSDKGKRGNGNGPSWNSALNSCLPVFWAVALSIRTLNVLSFEEDNDFVFFLAHFAIPTTASVTMATACGPQHESSVIMASILCASACKDSVVAGLLSGWLVSQAATYTVHWCISIGVPATMTSLLVSGGVGIAGATLMALVAPFLRSATSFLRDSIHIAMNGSFPGVGFAVGCLSCYFCKVGFYHSIWLPLSLIEMELGKPSILGTIDEGTLVLVCCGVCLAYLLSGTRAKDGNADTHLCARAVRINILYGDFVEAAYPFMENSVIVNVSGYIASGVSTEILAQGKTEVIDLLSMAYLPLPFSVLLANDQNRILLSYGAAFGISFFGAFVAILLESKRDSKTDETSRLKEK